MTDPRSVFAVNTYSYMFRMSAAECIAHLADRGWKAFEIMLIPGHLWPADIDTGGRAALRRLVEARDLRIVSLNIPNVDLNVAGATQEMRAYTIDVLARAIELAGDLGVEGVIVGPGKPNPLLPAPRAKLRERYFAALDRLLPVARRAGTSIFAENMTVAYVPDADGLMQELAAYGSDEIGVCYDVANAHFIGEDPAAGLRRVAERLRLVHLSDTTTAAYRHDPVGRGDVPFERIPPVLAEIGHGEMPMLEIIVDVPDADPVASGQLLLEMGWHRPHR